MNLVSYPPISNLSHLSKVAFNILLSNARHIIYALLQPVDVSTRFVSHRSPWSSNKPGLIWYDLITTSNCQTKNPSVNNAKSTVSS